jgi:hypothetical protein
LFVFLDLFIDDQGSRVICRSVSVRPNHLSIAGADGRQSGGHRSAQIALGNALRADLTCHHERFTYLLRLARQGLLTQCSVGAPLLLTDGARPSPPGVLPNETIVSDTSRAILRQDRPWARFGPPPRTRRGPRGCRAKGGLPIHPHMDLTLVCGAPKRGAARHSRIGGQGG